MKPRIFMKMKTMINITEALTRKITTQELAALTWLSDACIRVLMHGCSRDVDISPRSNQCVYVYDLRAAVEWGMTKANSSKTKEAFVRLNEEMLTAARYAGKRTTPHAQFAAALDCSKAAVYRAMTELGAPHDWQLLPGNTKRRVVNPEEFCEWIKRREELCPPTPLAQTLLEAVEKWTALPSSEREARLNSFTASGKPLVQREDGTQREDTTMSVPVILLPPVYRAAVKAFGEARLGEAIGNVLFSHLTKYYPDRFKEA